MYSAIEEFGADSAMQEKTVAYLAAHMESFIRAGEKALICLDDDAGLARLMEQAVIRCGGQPVLWGSDHRWKTLLRLAFSSRATTIIGTPLVVLGLSKLKNANGTPLPVRNVVTAGYPCFDWMMDGIARGYDCQVWSCLCLGLSGVVAGFSCEKNRHIHLWDAEYTLGIEDEQGRPLPAGESGRWTVSPRSRPAQKLSTGGFGKLELSPCACGDPAPRVLDLRPVDTEDKELAELAQYLLSWTSVLDFSLNRGFYGLELEMICFPGEKLPKLPTCARRVVRPWDPEKDEPFPYLPGRKKKADFADSH